MMSRKFTTREKVLLLLCAVILLGILYYRFVYIETTNAVEAYSTLDLEDELLIAQTTASKIDAMKEEVESGKSQVKSVVATYNNLQNEINSLNNILAGADSFNLSFEDATLEGDTVRRNISVSFHTGDYASMKAILQKLHDCEYRCLIRDIQISTTSTQGTGIKTSGDLNVNLTVTFYETTVNATSTAGLVQTQTPEESAGAEE